MRGGVARKDHFIQQSDSFPLVGIRNEAGLGGGAECEEEASDQKAGCCQAKGQSALTRIVVHPFEAFSGQGMAHG